MKKIKICPAPQVELRIAVTDKMIDDYRECYRLASKGDYDRCNCSACSWNDVKVVDEGLCQMKELEQLLEVSE